jgi:hypothetical protein
LVLAAGGCGSKQIEPEEAADIRRLAVVTYHESDELLVFDRTGSQVDTSVEVAAGLVGGAIGGAVVGAVEAVLASKAARRSLGGDPAALSGALRAEPMAPIIDRGITAGLGDLPALGPLDLQRLGFAASSRRTSDGVSVHDYRPLMDRWSIDTVVEIRARHGLAAYDSAPARPMVLAELFVIDVVEDRVIMQSTISSEDAYQSAHYIPELAAAGGALYRSDIEAASRALGGLVAAELRTAPATAGAKSSLPAGGDSFEAGAALGDESEGIEFREAVSAWKLSCSYPVALERDCSSFLGPKRQVELGGVEVRLSGSADGRQVLVLRTSSAAALTGRLDEQSRRAYLALRDKLRARAIGIVAVTPVEASGKRMGYILELDGNGYDVVAAPADVGRE